MWEKGETKWLYLIFGEIYVRSVEKVGVRYLVQGIDSVVEVDVKALFRQSWLRRVSQMFTAGAVCKAKKLYLVRLPVSVEGRERVLSVGGAV